MKSLGKIKNMTRLSTHFAADAHSFNSSRENSWKLESEEDSSDTTSVIHVHAEGEDAPRTFIELSSSDIPEHLPILPLRGVVVYPHTALPLTIGQPRSIRLVDDVVAGHRLILLRRYRGFFERPTALYVSLCAELPDLNWGSLLH
jgi:hypothetical protein